MDEMRDVGHAGRGDMGYASSAPATKLGLEIELDLSAFRVKMHWRGDSRGVEAHEFAEQSM